MNASMDNKTEVIESSDTKLQPMYKLLLHNDDVNDMIRVTFAIHDVMKFEMNKCYALMMVAHKNGLVLLKTEPQEHAEFHQEQLQTFNLTVTIEPE